MQNELSPRQIEQLLKPLNPTRVAKRSGGGGKQLAYLETWDVKAHLTRIFGFGGWSWDVLEADLAYAFGPDGDRQKNHQVGYKVIGRLSIHATGATFTEAAVGSASLPQVGEAHDMAVKTAESDALKRAAINLGDQFGLSLYDNGSTKAVVGAILSGQTPLVEAPVSAVEPSESPEERSIDPEPASPPSDSEGASEWIERLSPLVKSGDVAGVVALKTQIPASDMGLIYQGVTLSKWIDKGVVEAGKASA